jgi:hypothetical protein
VNAVKDLEVIMREEKIKIVREGLRLEFTLDEILDGANDISIEELKQGGMQALDISEKYPLKTSY